MNSVLFFLLAFAYLMGSIPTAIIVCKLMRAQDPREHGSGNPGATNVLRVAGKKAAFITLLGDALKGALPVLLAKAIGATDSFSAYIGLFAVLGHLFPIFLGFKGGKGVATTLGVAHAWHWPSALLMDGIWLLTARLSGISSVGALAALASLPLLLLFFAPDYTVCGGIIAILSIYKHKSNIQSLLSGTERKIKTPTEKITENKTQH